MFFELNFEVFEVVLKLDGRIKKIHSSLKYSKKMNIIEIMSLKLEILYSLKQTRLIGTLL
jgi:hypothetical protein